MHSTAMSDGTAGLEFPPEEPLSDEDVLRMSVANLHSSQLKAQEREAQLLSELEAVSAKLVSAEQHASSISDSLRAHEEKLNDKERHITNLQLQLERQMTNSSDKELVVSDLRHANREIAMERDGLQEELFARQEEIKRLHEITENLELALKRAPRRTSGQTAMLEEELQAYKDELQRLQEGSKMEREKWEDEVAEWEGRFQQLQEEHDAKLEQVSAEALQVVDEQAALVEALIKEERERMAADFDLQLDELAQQLAQVEEAHKAEQKRWMAEMSQYEEQDGLAVKLQGDIDSLKEVVLELEEANARLAEEKSAGLALLHAKGEALRRTEEACEFIKQQTETTAHRMAELEDQAENALADRNEMEAKYSHEINVLMEQVANLENEVHEAQMREEALRDESAATVSRIEESFRMALEEKEQLEEKFNSVLIEAEAERSVLELQASAKEAHVLEREMLQEEIEGLKAKLAALQEASGALGTESSGMNEALERAEEEARADLENALKEKDILEQELLWTAGALENLMNEMQAQQDANAALQDEVHALASASPKDGADAELRAENENLRAELASLQETVEGLADAGESDLLERIQQLEADLRDRELLIEEYQTGIRGIESELDAIQNAQLERDNALVEQNEKIAALEQACQALQSQRDEARAEAGSVEAECQRLRETIKSKEDVLMGLHHEMEDMQAELDSVRRELSVSPGTATFTISGDVLQELELTKQQNELLQKELDSAKATIAKYKSENRVAKEEAKKWRQQLEENAIAVTQEIQEINDTITQIATDKAAAEERASQAEAQTGEVLRMIESMEERLSNNQRELEKRAQRLKELLEDRKALKATASSLEKKYEAILKEKDEEGQALAQEARINLEEVQRLQERINFLQQEHSAQLEATVSQLQEVRKGSLEHQEEAERMARRYEHILAKKTKLDKRLSSMQAKLKRQNALLKQKEGGKSATSSSDSSSGRSGTRTRSALRSLPSGSVSEVRLSDISSDLGSESEEASEFESVADNSVAASRSFTSRRRGRAPLGVLTSRATPEAELSADGARGEPEEEPTEGVTTSLAASSVVFSGQRPTRPLYDDSSVSALFASDTAKPVPAKTAGRPKRKPLGVISTRGDARRRISPPKEELSETSELETSEISEAAYDDGKENGVGEAVVERSARKRGGRPALASPSTSLTGKRRARTAHQSSDIIAAASVKRSARTTPLSNSKGQVSPGRRSRRPRKSISQAGMGEEDSQDCAVQ